MSRYMIICRLRWPALLLLTGVIALLDQANILSWGTAWPLYLILLGVLALAERTALAAEPPPSYPSAYPSGYPYGYQPAGYQPAGYPGAAPAAAPPATGIVQVHGSEADQTPARADFRSSNGDENEGEGR